MSVCKRRMDTSVTLLLLDSTRIGRLTYNRPTQNISVIPIFFRIERCSLMSCGIGRRQITKSRVIFVAAPLKL